MGDRANIFVENEKGGVFLYTHWEGTQLPIRLQHALQHHWRWEDESYLTRIIFDEMTKEKHDTETGYGIATYPPDGYDRVLIISVREQMIYRGRFDWNEYKTVRSSTRWSFYDYCKLTFAELLTLWEE